MDLSVDYCRLNPLFLEDCNYVLYKINICILLNAKLH